MQKILYVFSFLFLQLIAHGQTNVTYQEFPKKWQLYPRDSLNKAIVPVKGSILQASNYDAISLKIIREEKPTESFFYKKQALFFDANKQATFDFQPQIVAGLIEYDIFLYGFKGKDSTLLATTTKITCGDVVLFYGQSNAVATADIPNCHIENEFARTIYGNGDNFFWYYSELGTEVRMGCFASQLALQIKDKYQMPICIINGAVGSKSIIDLSDRDANNPTNLTTNYGKFLDQATLAKVTKSAKILVWRQGEYEAEAEYLAELYPDNFKKIYQYFMTDFPNLKKIYVFQNNLYGTVNNNAGQLRDFQRKTATIYPTIEAVATVGTVSFDGLHYQTSGYLQSGLELSRIVGRDFYGESNNQNLSSPAIQKCILNSAKNQISLYFGANQTFSPPDLTTIGVGGTVPKFEELKRFIYLDGNDTKIDTILFAKDRINFKLKDTLSVKSLTYLPPYLGLYEGVIVFQDILLKNSLGMRALTFDTFPVANEITFIDFKAALSFPNQAKIDWQLSSSENSKIYVERAIDKSENFVLVATLTNGEVSYLDKILSSNTRYFYRIRATSVASESSYSDIKSILTDTITGIVTNPTNPTTNPTNPTTNPTNPTTNPTNPTTNPTNPTTNPTVVTGIVSATENEVLQIYPNPTENGKFFSEIKTTYKYLIIRDLNGKIVRQIENNQQKIQQISVENLPSGVYLVEVLTKSNTKITKKLIIP